jgi:hypothetical protein
MAMRVKLIGLAAGLALAVVGCAANPAAQGPSTALRAYAHALDSGRVDEAYRLLSDEAKRNLPLEAFRRAVKENPEDIREIARAIARPTSDPVVTATVAMPNGDELLLVYEGGRWRINAAAIDLYGQATPRQALVGFVRAFERKRYDVILRYVPEAEKEGLVAAAPTGEPSAPIEQPQAHVATPAPAGDAAPTTSLAPSVVRLTPEKLRAAWEGPQKEQMSRIVQAIKTALPTAVIEETGDSAAMAYGSNGTVALMREHGVWKIRDF